MTIIDGVRAWLKTYEGLADGRLSVDFLPEEAKSYSVDTVPTTEIVKRYIKVDTEYECSPAGVDAIGVYRCKRCGKKIKRYW